MATEKHTIFWVTRRPAKFEAQRFAPLCLLLAQQGYQISWIEMPAGLSAAEFETWLAEKLSQPCSAIFFGDKEVHWAKPLIAQIRTKAAIATRYAAIVWIYEDGDHPLLENISDVGFNDFFGESIGNHELGLRLTLRQREAEARQKQDEVIREQVTRIIKNETVVKQREEFLGVCAHDLRSPLGLIQTSATMILAAQSGKQTLSANHHELLSRIKRQAVQAIQLVNDLLDVMSFEQGFQPQYHLVDVDGFLKEFHKDHSQIAAEKKVTFKYENTIPQWRVLADEDRIRQLLQNLFSNAIKFTDSGKTISLRVSSFQGRRKKDPPYPMVIITLKDEGKGIPPREMQRLFDRFTQIKDHSSPEGRGLGLTVAKQISQLHDGNVWAESELGKGSTFHLLLPRVVSRTEALTAEEKKARSKPCLVVVESSAERRELFFQNMERWGVDIIFAQDGVEGVALIYHHLPDAVILTPDTKKMSVDDVVGIIKKDPLIRTIPLFLATPETDEIKDKFDLQLFDRILKLPLDQSEFETTLRSIGKTPAGSAHLKKVA